MGSVSMLRSEWILAGDNTLICSSSLLCCGWHTADEGRGTELCQAAMKAPNLVPVSSCSVLLWALCSVATGLIDEGAPDITSTTTPAFTPCYNLTESASNQFEDATESVDWYNEELGCGSKSVDCDAFCSLCDRAFPSRMECYSHLYQETCYKTFKYEMELVNHTDWCNWENVKRMYNTFTLCTEDIAECLKIPWPNWMVENRFVDIHATFFRDCPNKELSDPPPSIVFALVMAPICLIPIMVVLVVLKTKNGDGSS
ncbi:hypothetical protein DPEC_G00277900 [Dallia pectoralis]|uniref:Uncharacterized protein n=1 Tax=Dallia pectoralis TaxID=75939 RepID=A0ACC2FLR1_DALPE|nr:hypothetical protein DPEC_G00277900 [Dallia pectoralis]